MKTRHWQNRIFGTLMGLFFLFGFVAALNTTAQAQYRNDQDETYRRDQDRDRDRDRDRDWDRDRDRRDRRNRDWNRRGGWRGRRSNDDYPDYGGSFQLRQTALNAGYNEGIKEGRNDRRKGDRYDFRDEREYQRASKDYSSRYGDRDLYSRYFRMAFENGYDAGWNGY